MNNEYYVSEYKAGNVNEVIGELYNKHNRVFKQTASKFYGLDEATIESIIYEQIWKCLENYDESKSNGKLTTMICTYIRNACRSVTESNNLSKRKINQSHITSNFSEFEEPDRLTEISELTDYTKIEMMDYLDTLELTYNQRSYCELAINGICDLTKLSEFAEILEISCAGVLNIKLTLKNKMQELIA